MGNPNTSLAVAPVQRYKVVVDRLATKREELARVLPPHLGVDRFITIVQNSLIRQPALLECEPNSIMRVCAQSAELGLELGGALGESYIVPFWNKKKQRKIATFIAGYKGLIKLALDAPKIELIEAVLVHKADVFEYEKGTSPRIIHKPTMGRAKGEVIAAYCRVLNVSGAQQFEVMDDEELGAIEGDVERRLGKMFWASPWRSNNGAHRSEMLRKCPIRKISKTLTLSAGLKKALEIEMMNEGANRLNDSLGGERTDALKSKIAGSPAEPSPAHADAIEAEWEPGDEEEEDHG